MVGIWSSFGKTHLEGQIKQLQADHKLVPTENPGQLSVEPSSNPAEPETSITLEDLNKSPGALYGRLLIEGEGGLIHREVIPSFEEVNQTKTFQTQDEIPQFEGSGKPQPASIHEEIQPVPSPEVPTPPIPETPAQQNMVDKIKAMNAELAKIPAKTKNRQAKIDKLVDKFVSQITDFDEKAYLEANPDVAEALSKGGFRGSGLRHYIEYGVAEGRKLAVLIDGAPPAEPKTDEQINNDEINRRLADAIGYKEREREYTNQRIEAEQDQGKRDELKKLLKQLDTELKILHSSGEGSEAAQAAMRLADAIFSNEQKVIVERLKNTQDPMEKAALEAEKKMLEEGGDFLIGNVSEDELKTREQQRQNEADNKAVAEGIEKFKGQSEELKKNLETESDPEQIARLKEQLTKLDKNIETLGTWSNELVLTDEQKKLQADIEKINKAGRQGFTSMKMLEERREELDQELEQSIDKSKAEKRALVLGILAEAAADKAGKVKEALEKAEDPAERIQLQQELDALQHNADASLQNADPEKFRTMMEERERKDNETAINEASEFTKKQIEELEAKLATDPENQEYKKQLAGFQKQLSTLGGNSESLETQVKRQLRIEALEKEAEKAKLGRKAKIEAEKKQLEKQSETFETSRKAALLLAMDIRKNVVKTMEEKLQNDELTDVERFQLQMDLAKKQKGTDNLLRQIDPRAFDQKQQEALETVNQKTLQTIVETTEAEVEKLNKQLKEASAEDQKGIQKNINTLKSQLTTMKLGLAENASDPVRVRALQMSQQILQQRLSETSRKLRETTDPEERLKLFDELFGTEDSFEIAQDEQVAIDPLQDAKIKKAVEEAAEEIKKAAKDNKAKDEDFMEEVINDTLGLAASDPKIAAALAKMVDNMDVSSKSPFKSKNSKNSKLEKELDKLADKLEAFANVDKYSKTRNKEIQELAEDFQKELGEAAKKPRSLMSKIGSALAIVGATALTVCTVGMATPILIMTIAGCVVNTVNQFVENKWLGYIGTGLSMGAGIGAAISGAAGAFQTGYQVAKGAVNLAAATTDIEWLDKVSTGMNIADIAVGGFKFNGNNIGMKALDVSSQVLPAVGSLTGNKTLQMIGAATTIANAGVNKPQGNSTQPGGFGQSTLGRTLQIAIPTVGQFSSNPLIQHLSQFGGALAGKVGYKNPETGRSGILGALKDGFSKMGNTFANAGSTIWNGMTDIFTTDIRDVDKKYMDKLFDGARTQNLKERLEEIENNEDLNDKQKEQLKGQLTKASIVNSQTENFMQELGALTPENLGDYKTRLANSEIPAELQEKLLAQASLLAVRNGILIKYQEQLDLRNLNQAIADIDNMEGLSNEQKSLIKQDITRQAITNSEMQHFTAESRTMTTEGLENFKQRLNGSEFISEENKLRFLRDGQSKVLLDTLQNASSNISENVNEFINGMEGFTEEEKAAIQQMANTTLSIKGAISSAQNLDDIASIVRDLQSGNIAPQFMQNIMLSLQEKHSALFESTVKRLNGTKDPADVVKELFENLNTDNYEFRLELLEKIDSKLLPPNLKEMLGSQLVKEAFSPTLGKEAVVEIETEVNQTKTRENNAREARRIAEAQKKVNAHSDAVMKQFMEIYGVAAQNNMHIYNPSTSNLTQADVPRLEAQKAAILQKLNGSLDINIARALSNTVKTPHMLELEKQLADVNKMIAEANKPTSEEFKNTARNAFSLLDKHGQATAKLTTLMQYGTDAEISKALKEFNSIEAQLNGAMTKYAAAIGVEAGQRTVTLNEASLNFKKDNMGFFTQAANGFSEWVIDHSDYVGGFIGEERTFRAQDKNLATLKNLQNNLVKAAQEGNMIGVSRLSDAIVKIAKTDRMLLNQAVEFQTGLRNAGFDVAATVISTAITGGTSLPLRMLASAAVGGVTRGGLTAIEMATDNVDQSTSEALMGLANSTTRGATIGGISRLGQTAASGLSQYLGTSKVIQNSTIRRILTNTTEDAIQDSGVSISNGDPASIVAGGIFGLGFNGALGTGGRIFGRIGNMFDHVPMNGASQPIHLFNNGVSLNPSLLEIPDLDNGMSPIHIGRIVSDQSYSDAIKHYEQRFSHYFDSATQDPSYRSSMPTSDEWNTLSSRLEKIDPLLSTNGYLGIGTGRIPEARRPELYHSLNKMADELEGHGWQVTHNNDQSIITYRGAGIQNIDSSVQAANNIVQPGSWGEWQWEKMNDLMQDPAAFSRLTVQQQAEVRLTQKMLAEMKDLHDNGYPELAYTHAYRYNYESDPVLRETLGRGTDFDVNDFIQNPLKYTDNQDIGLLNAMGLQPEFKQNNIVINKPAPTLNLNESTSVNLIRNENGTINIDETINTAYSNYSNLISYGDGITSFYGGDMGSISFRAVRIEDSAYIRLKQDLAQTLPPAQAEEAFRQIKDGFERKVAISQSEGIMEELFHSGIQHPLDETFSPVSRNILEARIKTGLLLDPQNPNLKPFIEDDIAGYPLPPTEYIKGQAQRHNSNSPTPEALWKNVIESVMKENGVMALGRLGKGYQFSQDFFNRHTTRNWFNDPAFRMGSLPPHTSQAIISQPTSSSSSTTQSFNFAMRQFDSSTSLNTRFPLLNAGRQVSLNPELFEVPTLEMPSVKPFNIQESRIQRPLPDLEELTHYYKEQYEDIYRYELGPVTSQPADVFYSPENIAENTARFRETWERLERMDPELSQLFGSMMAEGTDYLNFASSRLRVFEKLADRLEANNWQVTEGENPVLSYNTGGRIQVNADPNAFPIIGREPVIAVIDDYFTKDPFGPIHASHGELVEAFAKSQAPDAKILQLKIDGNSEGVKMESVQKRLHDAVSMVEAGETIDAITLSLGVSESIQKWAATTGLPLTPNNLHQYIPQLRTVASNRRIGDILQLMDRLNELNVPVFISAGNRGAHKFNLLGLSQNNQHIIGGLDTNGQPTFNYANNSLISNQTLEEFTFQPVNLEGQLIGYQVPGYINSFIPNRLNTFSLLVGEPLQAATDAVTIRGTSFAGPLALSQHIRRRQAAGNLFGQAPAFNLGRKPTPNQPK